MMSNIKLWLSVERVILHIFITDSVVKADCSLWYRLQVLLQSVCHAGQQVEVIVHTAAYTLIHKRTHGWILRPRVKQVFGFIVAVHSTSCQTILKDRQYILKKTTTQQ